MKKILFLAAIGLLFAAGNADAKAVKLGKSDDGGSRIAAAKEKRVKSVKCEKGQFKNSDGVCVGCTVANCAECKSAGVCKRCNAGYSVLSGGTCGCASHAVCGDKQICENKICVDLPCPDGYYASEHKCKACSSNCLTCSDQNTCTSCEPGKYLSGGSCNGCSAKFSHCLECDPSKCTKCDGETDKINGVCVEQGCKTSADCAGNQVCNASHECEECQEGYEKWGDSCVPEGSDPECTIDAECDENEKCENGGCVLKTCAEINADYTAAECAKNQTTNDVGVTGFNGACHTCTGTNGCSGNADCGSCQTCSNGQCVNLSCGEGKTCDDNHGCKDIGCSSDCDCQWWEVCSNKKCVTASSCTSLDACKRSKGEGGNYQSSNSGSCSVVPNKTYINVANLYCYVCPKEGNNTPKCENGLKVGTCAYVYDKCPTGWKQANTYKDSCVICNPSGEYEGECCSGNCGGSSGGSSCTKGSVTTGTVSNGSKVYFSAGGPAWNAFESTGCIEHLASMTINLSCDYKGLHGAPGGEITCSGCTTVTCTHKHGGSFTVTGVQYKPTLVCNGPAGCHEE